MKDDVVVDGDVARLVAVGAKVIAKEAAIHDEATTAECKVVAEHEHGVGIDADVTGQAGVAGRQHNKAGVPVHERRRVIHEVACEGSDLNAHFIGVASCEDIFEEGGPTSANQNRAKVNTTLVATATQEVFSIRGCTQSIIEIERFRLMGIANPPVAIGDRGWIEFLAVESVIKGKHTVEWASGFHLDLARCRGAGGNDGGQGTIVGDAQAAKPIAVRTEINSIAVDVSIVRDAKQTTGLDLNIARAERCPRHGKRRLRC